jgi:hypothetical protein
MIEPHDREPLALVLLLAGLGVVIGLILGGVIL